MATMAQTVTIILTALTLTVAAITGARHRIKRTVDRFLARTGPIIDLNQALASQQRDISQINQSLQSISRQQQADVLMRRTFSRKFHEYQILTGEQYLEGGGNGVAKIQYQVLADDYNRRLTTGDWEY